MLINISQKEIEQAIKQHIESQGIGTRNKDVVITLETKGGRKTPKQITARVAISAHVEHISSADTPAAVGDDVDFS